MYFNCTALTKPSIIRTLIMIQELTNSNCKKQSGKWTKEIEIIMKILGQKCSTP